MVYRFIGFIGLLVSDKLFSGSNPGCLWGRPL